jgi:membrane fusion protein
MIVQPVSHGILTIILALFAVSAVTYLATSSYARTETVQGYVAPSSGLAQLHANHGGIIARVLVHEGDLVTQGQPLIELSLDTVAKNGSSGDRVRAQIQTRIGEVEAEMTASDAHLQAENKRLTERAAAIRAELASLDQQLGSETTSLALQKDAALRVATLEAQGYGTRLELDRRQQQVQTEISTIHALEQQREQRRGDLRDVLNQLALLPTDHATRLAQLRSAKAEQEQALAQQDVNQNYVLTAPLKGRVVGLQAEVGQTAASQTPLVALMPEDSTLEAHLLVPSRSTGLIQAGQEVRVRIDAFPYQRFGMISGHVAQISRAAYRPGELLAPIPYQDTVYRVIVSLDRSSVTVYGENRPLTPGMTLTADVVTDRRHLIDWILDPLRAASLQT